MSRLSTPSTGALPPRLVLVEPPAPPRPANGLWWLNPVAMLMLGVLPVYAAVYAFDFRGLVPVIYVPGSLYFFGFALIAALAAGAQWAISTAPPGPPRAPPHISKGVMLALLLPALLAYAVWFGPLLVNSHLLLMLLSGERSHLRNDLSILTGVTSFTQFGVAYVIAYALKSGARVQQVSRLERAGFIAIVLLAFLRAFAWAERLALIEVGLSFLVTRLAYLPIRRLRYWRLAYVAPVFGLGLLYLIFTGSEYVRSWEFYAHRYDSVWAYTLDRLIAYYATGVNNGVGLLTEGVTWPELRGAWPFDPLFKMPGVGSLLAAVFGEPPRTELAWMEVFANPEFNTFTAYFMAVHDLGYAGAMVFLLAMGYVIGRAYVGMRLGHKFGLLAYGVLVVFMGESLRYNYLTETRVVSMMAGLLLVAWDMHRPRPLET